MPLHKLSRKVLVSVYAIAKISRKFHFLVQFCTLSWKCTYVKYVKSLYFYKKSMSPNPYTPQINSTAPYLYPHGVFLLQIYQSSWKNVYKYLEIWLTKNLYLENTCQKVTADHQGMMGITGWFLKPTFQSLRVKTGMEKQQKLWHLAPPPHIQMWQLLSHLPLSKIDPHLWHFQIWRPCLEKPCHQRSLGLQIYPKNHQNPSQIFQLK